MNPIHHWRRALNINIITEPHVYLLGVSCFVDSGTDGDPGGLREFLGDQGIPGWELDDSADSAALLAEVGGRLCYMSFAKPRPGGNAAYVAHILQSGHGSVLEHAVFTLILTGISRSCSHELVRHRHLSPSQLSQRYVDASDVAFVVPPALMDEVQQAAAMVDRSGCFAVEVLEYRTGQLTEAQRAGLWWLDMAESALLEYRRLSEYMEGKYADLPGKTARRKQAREAARSVLPNCVETKIQLTGNARAWRNFLDQRATPHADAEMRRLAVAIHRVLVAESPNLFGDYTPAGDGSLSTPYRKV